MPFVSGRRTWPAIAAGALALVVALVAAVVLTRSDAEAKPDGPVPIRAGLKPEDPDYKRSHWHAALGVYDCDHWVGNGPRGPGTWDWPNEDETGIYRAGTRTYAGLHSHGDGVMHMEPFMADEAGDNATVGRYFEFGGWSVDEDGFTFLDVTRRNGDRCGDADGEFSWSVNGKRRRGNPADYKLYDDDIVVLAFLPADRDVEDLEEPPSAPNLPNRRGGEGA